MNLLLALDAAVHACIYMYVRIYAALSAGGGVHDGSDGSGGLTLTNLLAPSHAFCRCLSVWVSSGRRL